MSLADAICDALDALDHLCEDAGDFLGPDHDPRDCKICALRAKRMYLTRDAILERQDIPTENVDVPEWGGTVRVRGMSGVERDKFEASLIEHPQANGRRQRGRREQQTNMDNIRAKMAAWCCVDCENNRLFSESDVQALGGKSAAALARIFDVATRLSGITEEDVDEMAQEMIEHPFDETS